MKETVLLIEPTILPVGVEYLQNRYHVVMAPNASENTLIQYANRSGAKGMITRAEPISANIIRACPELQVIGQPGVGVDNINVEACTENGVIVVHAPEGNYVSVAEHTIMFILALSRNLVSWDQRIRQGDWGFRNSALPMEIHSKILFLIGFGRSSRETARMARALGLKVIVFSRSWSAEQLAELGLEKVETVQAGMEQADFISLHVPLTPQTRHLISSKEIAGMKNDAFLINLSRGPVVDSSALYNALKNNRIAGAALDVMDREPPLIDDPLLSLKNVIFTPHIAGDTQESWSRCIMTAVQEVDKVLQGESPRYVANPEVLEAASLRAKRLELVTF